MRALVTGGAGFIGSHLAEALLKSGHQVQVLDDLSTGSLDNVARVRTHPGFEICVDSVANESVLARNIERCDVVYHLAAAVGVRLIIDAPVRTIETNVHATEVVLRHAARARRRVLITSTSEVYGKNGAVPFREDADLVLGPTSHSRWAYACSKAMDEFLGLAYWKEQRLPVVIARLFNTVGPRQTGRYGMVIPTFVQQALSGQPITVFGDGTQTRSFADVSDVVTALVGLMEEPGAAGGIFNIGNDQETSIRSLAEAVKRATDSRSPIRTIPYDEAYEAGFEDMPRRVPDLRKVQTLLGWQPKSGLDAILTRVVAHARQQAARTAPVERWLEASLNRARKPAAPALVSNATQDLRGKPRV